MSGRLFVVGTPIGNLGDLSERARATLGSVDMVAAEDTRRTGKLLAHIGVTARMISLFEGNERARTEQLMEELRRGAQVALVSDAGMPNVSDPGFRLVRACAAEGIEVRVVPGPSAVTAALAISGLPTDRWAFEGFLPRRASDRRARLRELVEDPRTVVLFESPRRAVTTLRDLLRALGDRRVVVARELTKLHEDVVRGRLSEVLDAMSGSEPRGEIVVVLEGAGSSEPPLDDLVDEARGLVAAGMRKRDAATDVARRRGGAANEIYEALVAPR